MKVNKYRTALVSLSLVLFLGFGWIDSLKSLFDYMFFGSVPTVSQSTGSGTLATPGQAATLDGTGGPQCPGCPRPRPPGIPPPPSGF
jgi:hypothetical protein